MLLELRMTDFWSWSWSPHSSSSGWSSSSASSAAFYFVSRRISLLMLRTRSCGILCYFITLLLVLLFHVDLTWAFNLVWRHALSNRNLFFVIDWCHLQNDILWIDLWIQCLLTAIRVCISEVIHIRLDSPLRWLLLLCISLLCIDIIPRRLRVLNLLILHLIIII